MSPYSTPLLEYEPYEAVEVIEAEDPYAIPAGDDDEHEVEEEMDGLENRPDVGSPEWKKIISEIQKPPLLPLQGNYALEKKDSKHRMGDLLGVCFGVYKKEHPADPDGHHFYEWLDAMSDLDRVIMIANHGLVRQGKYDSSSSLDTRTNIKPSMVKAFMKGVAYLDRVGRKNHRVKFVAGTAMLNDQELSTSEMQTVLSGKGFAIWVMSEKGKMYVGNHIKGMLHHSSFLAGADVMCGGEVKAHMGKITYLSAKTGHYRALSTHFACALRVLETCVNNLDDIKIAAWKPPDQKVRIISPRTLMLNPASYEAWGNLHPKDIEKIRSGDFSSFPTV